MLHAVVVVTLLRTLANGIPCDQFLIQSWDRTVLNMSHLGLHDHDLLDLCRCSNLNGSALSAIQVLDLRGNQLTGRHLPMALPCIPQTQHLFLSSNPITELGDTTFQGLRYLQHVDLSKTPIRNLTSSVFYPISHTLRHLSIEATLLERIPDDMFVGSKQALWALATLNLAENPYLAQLPPNIFQHLYALQSINVSATAVPCWPSSPNPYLNRFPLSMPDCMPRVDPLGWSPLRRGSYDVGGRRLLWASETFSTERVVFRLSLDYDSMTSETRARTTSDLIADISASAGIDAGRVVNVELGPGTLFATIVQLDILQASAPTSSQAIASLKKQSVSAVSRFRTGLVTSYYDPSSYFVSAAAQVRSCSSTLYVDVAESCPAEEEAQSFASLSNPWIYVIIVASIIVTTAALCFVRISSRYRSEQRLREAMTDVINLSLGRDLATPPSIQMYVSPSPSFPRQDNPYAVLSPSVPPERQFSLASPSGFESSVFQFGKQRSPTIETTKLTSISKAQPSVTIVKRPGLNAIRSKRMLLLSGSEGDDSMLDTDAEF